MPTDRTSLSQATNKAPIIAELSGLMEEISEVVLNDNSGRNPREVIEHYIHRTDPNLLVEYFGILLINNCQATMSGNLRPTTPKMMATLYLRVYLWGYIRFDEKIKAKYATTIHAGCTL